MHIDIWRDSVYKAKEVDFYVPTCMRLSSPLHLSLLLCTWLISTYLELCCVCVSVATNAVMVLWVPPPHISSNILEGNRNQAINFHWPKVTPQCHGYIYCAALFSVPKIYYHKLCRDHMTKVTFVAMHTVCIAMYMYHTVQTLSTFSGFACALINTSTIFKYPCSAAW